METMSDEEVERDRAVYRTVVYQSEDLDVESPMCHRLTFLFA